MNNLFFPRRIVLNECLIFYSIHFNSLQSTDHSILFLLLHPIFYFQRSLNLNGPVCSLCPLNRSSTSKQEKESSNFPLMLTLFLVFLHPSIPLFLALQHRFIPTPTLVYILADSRPLSEYESHILFHDRSSSELLRVSLHCTLFLHSCTPTIMYSCSTNVVR